MSVGVYTSWESIGSDAQKIQIAHGTKISNTSVDSKA